MALGLLAAGFDRGAVAGDEFDDWYDTEHIPERLRVPGFLSAQRWIGANAPAVSVALYDLASRAVLDSAAYRAIAGENLSPWSKRIVGRCRRLLRLEAEQAYPGAQRAPEGAGALLLVAFELAPEAEPAFELWCDHEELPRLAAESGCLAARRFRSERGTHRHAVLLHLASLALARANHDWERALQPPAAALREALRQRLRLVLRPYRPAAQPVPA